MVLLYLLLYTSICSKAIIGLLFRSLILLLRRGYWNLIQVTPGSSMHAFIGLYLLAICILVRLPFQIT
jgi:hypothetical protein